VVKVVVVFLGRRGAGAKFIEIFQEFHHEVPNVELAVFVSEALSTSSIDNRIYTHNCRTFENWTSIFIFPIVIVKLIRSLKSIPRWQESKFVFVLPSFSDYFVLRFIKSFNIPMLLFIHDIKRHKGDIWPLKASLKFRQKIATKIVTLSRYMNDVLEKDFGIISDLVMHPMFPIKFQATEYSNSFTSKRTILFIGRIRKYKGIDLLIKAYLSSGVMQEYDLIIAGSGKINMVDHPNIKYVNRWLSDDELQTFIANSTFVVLPYSEASQSGVIPICVAMRKPIIISETGALIEQLGSYQDWKSFQPQNYEQLRSCIETFAQRRYRNTSSKADLQYAASLSEQSSRDFVRTILSICKEI
jgi:glycosyltransferase involved in cell wall biosynthesis